MPRITEPVPRPGEGEGLCPCCLKVITHLNFREPVINYGRWTPDEWLTDDASDDGDITFRCPECDEEIEASGINSVDKNDVFDEACWEDFAAAKHRVLAPKAGTTPEQPGAVGEKSGEKKNTR